MGSLKLIILSWFFREHISIFIGAECLFQAVISSILKLFQNLNSWLATFMYSGLENLYFKVEMNFGFISIKNYLISLIASLRSSLV